MFKSIFTIAIVLFAVSANAWQYQGSTYSGDQAMQAQNAKLGTVEDIRRVQIVQQNQNYGGYAGTAVGAALGGLVGSKIGKGNGSTAAAVVGAALGGMGGYQAANHLNRNNYDALEITVSFQDGAAIVITQAIDQDAASLRPGDRVRVIGGGWGSNSARVARVGNQARQQANYQSF